MSKNAEGFRPGVMHNVTISHMSYVSNKLTKFIPKTVHIQTSISDIYNIPSIFFEQLVNDSNMGCVKVYLAYKKIYGFCDYGFCLYGFCTYGFWHPDPTQNPFSF